ncbi:zinc-dependent peptidase [Cecembia lonarensis]|uniref:DgsA anti-repressor MtfA n=1 Tax=Cecembia lonarensis (strain CCUG 58316 / KCTC 22772 / LW9) TaxID=1225176 RepID=K1L379_CECL9|nr:zinc-dependent peptidase [Cecembia lonarensis]EKB49246.1 DgsA anti-repressor MtfA [Cecembia lonarensis LW9]
MLFIYQFLQPFAELFQEIKILFKSKKLTPEDISILNRFFPYYKNLRPKHQREFRERLVRFIATKAFIPRGGLKSISREMELLIGATAVMVIFGFRNVELKHFSRILVYPDNYYSTINRTYHQGEVNPKLGIIVLSWKNFVEGQKNADGINLGVHEMAHALKLENQIHYNQESNFFNVPAWRKFNQLAESARNAIKEGSNTFFRKSAAANPHEFFAVALEAFFETPEAFKNQHEELYKSLVFLLKQDPVVLKN